MEGVNSDQPKILESIFLSKFLMCSQGHQNLKEIGRSIVKTQKRKKELEIINKTINNKMNKKGKTKSLRDYPIWMYQSLWLKIISKVKPSSLQLLMNRKRQGKKILQILFYLAQRTH